MTKLEAVRLTVAEMQLSCKGCGDHESLHAAEDDLYLSLLKAIAKGSCEDPQGCAKEALKTQKLKFERWCA